MSYRHGNLANMTTVIGFEVTVMSTEPLLKSEAAMTLGLSHTLEPILHEIARVLEILLELFAIVIIMIAVMGTLRKIVKRQLQHPGRSFQQSIRLELGLSLALALEFLLAADIIGTAVSPSWDAIARLASITGIRTFLNFFLQREVRELQELTRSALSISED